MYHKVKFKWVNFKSRHYHGTQPIGSNYAPWSYKHISLGKCSPSSPNNANLYIYIYIYIYMTTCVTSKLSEMINNGTHSEKVIKYLQLNSIRNKTRFRVNQYSV